MKHIINPLRDRKVQAALGVIVVAYAAEFGLSLNEGVVVAVLGTVVAAIAGHFAGAKAEAKKTPPQE